jgi:hypothetical protein
LWPIAEIRAEGEGGSGSGHGLDRRAILLSALSLTLFG